MSVRRVRGWIAAGAALLVCAGCGYKGPLYLPERNATVVTHPGAAQKKKANTPPAAQPPAPAGPAAP